MKELIGRAAALAPMAGFTDSAFRNLCKDCGAGITVSEMISAKAVRMGDKKSLELMHHKEKERPFGIQLFGTEPSDFEYAAKLAVDLFAPDFIDINMGCPAPKITGPGAGSKLMTTPELAAEIANATVKAVTVPVTAKIRAGYQEITAPSLAPVLEDSGISMLTVHARTRDQMYRPPIDQDVIRDVKRNVSIPVIGNGDINTPEDAAQMIEYTGCDGIMIGRGALGDPMLFARISAMLRGEDIPAPLSLEENLKLLIRQAADACEDKGEYVAMREMRKHTPYYLRGVNNAASFRARSTEICTLDELKELCDIVLAAGNAR